MQKTKQSQKTSVIQIRVNEQDKLALEKVLSKLGLTTSQAGMLYFKQILLKKRIPLDISLPEDDEDDSQVNFQKSQAKLVTKLDREEIIPEFSEQNARLFI